MKKRTLLEKGILSFVVSALCSLNMDAQVEHSLLWKVSKKGNENVSYLFGTMHTNDSLLNTFDETWWKALRSCHMLAGEVNFTDPKEIMSTLSTAMMKDSTLKDFYTPEELSRVQKFMTAKLDPMMAMMVSKMKPFYIMASIMEMPDEKSPYKEVMDLRLQSLAKEHNKNIVGLETVAEQASSIDVISLSRQAKLLLEFVDEYETMSKESEMMEKYYHAQDLESLAKIEAEYEAPEELMTSIVEGRNHRFVKKLIPYLEDQNVFCAVGALHLPGETGLIAQLREQGYTVEPVYFKFEKAKS